MKLDDIFNDHMVAFLGVFTAICILVAVLLEKYMPIPEVPEIKRSDEAIDKMTREELIKLEEQDPKLPLMTLKELKKYSGIKGQKAYVCCKGVIYDVSQNEVYASDGGYNSLAGKDATLSLGKMQLELAGKRGWREALDMQGLQTVFEWQKWYNERYTKIGYLVEEYELEKTNKQ